MKAGNQRDSRMYVCLVLLLTHTHTHKMKVIRSLSSINAQKVALKIKKKIQ